MKMDGQIRVFTDVKHRELFNNLKNGGVVADFHELFFVCACLGFRNGVRESIKKRDERFWSRTITPPEWACYYAMILDRHDNDLAFITDDKSVLAEIEQYANAGVAVLIDEFLRDYVVHSAKDLDPYVIVSVDKELPKEFLHYLFEQAEVEGVEA